MSNFKIPSPYIITKVIDNGKTYAAGYLEPLALAPIAPSQWLEITGPLIVLNETRNVTVHSDQFEIIQSGEYSIDFQLNAQIILAGVVTRTIEFGVGINGSNPTVGTGRATLFNITDSQTFAGSFTTYLKKGDLLSLFVRNITDTANIGLNQGTINVNKK